tara:strand:- start:3134 stop:3787 length:654 start_codon:yes stop_codon:yes gene_type:complete
MYTLPCYGDQILQWQTFYQDQTMIISTRSQSLAVDEVAVQLKVEAPISALVNVLLDVKNIPKWMFGVKQVNILQKYTEKEYLMQILFVGLGPIDARDIVAYVKVEQNPQDWAVTLEMRNRSQVLAKDPDFLRMIKAQATWHIYPCQAGQVVISYQGYFEPGGFMPSWWANFLHRFQHKRTWLNLKTYLSKPVYQKSLNFIQEPPASFRQWSALCKVA